MMAKYVYNIGPRRQILEVADSFWLMSSLNFFDSWTSSSCRERKLKRFSTRSISTSRPSLTVSRDQYCKNLFAVYATFLPDFCAWFEALLALDIKVLLGNNDKRILWLLPMVGNSNSRITATNITKVDGSFFTYHSCNR